jgi:AraC-like DNA-binding protein
VYVFVKDVDRRFVYYNKPFPVLMGRDGGSLLGLRDEDISPEYLVEKYRADDENVLRNGAKLQDLIELVHNEDGSYDWFTTTKFPVRSRSDDVVGVAGITRTVSRREQVGPSFLGLGPAVERIMTAFDRSPTIEELAQVVSLSPSQFSRQFKSRFGMTPHNYLRQVRLMAACNLLSVTDLTIAEVATRCGYFDQSHLTKEFLARRGMTPGSYRARFSDGGASGPLKLSV